MSGTGKVASARVIACARLRRERRLPVAGRVLVARGSTVAADTPVAEAELAGEMTALDAAGVLGLPAASVPAAVAVVPGDTVGVGDVLGRRVGPFGLFRRRLVSPVTGVVRSVSPLSGRVLIEGASRSASLTAFLAGEVTAILPERGVVIEGEAARIVGVFGRGGEVCGVLRTAVGDPGASLAPEDLSADMHGAVLLAGAGASAAALKRAGEIGVAALVLGGLDAVDLPDGSAPPVVLLTEGFGRRPMDPAVFALLAAREGRVAAVSGRTQIRAGVLRPEILVAGPPPPGETGGVIPASPPAEDGGTLALRVGDRVRVLRRPHRGARGVVTELPGHRRALASGVLTAVACLRLDDGTEAVVALRNLEPV